MLELKKICKPDTKDFYANGQSTDRHHNKHKEKIDFFCRLVKTLG
jgi:hypothetical protein